MPDSFDSTPEVVRTRAALEAHLRSSPEMAADQGAPDAAFNEWFPRQGHWLSNDEVCHLIWCHAWRAALATRQPAQAGTLADEASSSAVPDALGASASPTACSVASLPEPVPVSALRVPPAGASDPEPSRVCNHCTCYGEAECYAKQEHRAWVKRQR